MIFLTFRSRLDHASRHLPIPGAIELSIVEWHTATITNAMLISKKDDQRHISPGKPIIPSESKSFAMKYPPYILLIMFACLNGL